MLEEQRKKFPDLTSLPTFNPSLLSLCSFDIPQPTIHPPGTDPCSLSNPNLHGEHRLERLHALDVDPCAASRSEIVAKTTDLTPSEHAGQTFCEITKRSTISCSPRNSGVVTQPVSNSGETENNKHNAQEIPSNGSTTEDRDIVNFGQQRAYCEVCKVSCDTKIFSGHISGRRHKKKEKELATFCTPVVSMATAPVAVENSKSTKGKMVNSNFCEFDHDSSVLNTHMTSLHESEKILGLSSTPVASMTTPLFSEPEEHPKSTKGKIVISKLGEVNCSNNVLISTHLKNIQELEKIRGLPSTPIAFVATPLISELVEPPKSTDGEIVISKDGGHAWCKLCKANCHSNVLSRHLSGRKHQKNLAKSKKIPDSPSTRTASVATPPSTKPVKNMNVTEGNIVSLDDGKASYCSNVLQKSGNIPLSPSTPIALVTTPPAGHVEDPNPTKGETVISKEVKSAWCNLFRVRSPNEEGKMVILESCKRKSENEEEIDRKRRKDKVVNGTGAIFTCKLCNEVCNSATMFTAHLVGEKHTALSLKQVNVRSNGQKD